MPGGPVDPQGWGYYWALAQIGFEMVVPIGAGMLVEHYQPGWAPWATMTGAVLGFAGGLLHMMVLLKRYDKDKPSGPGRDQA
jgi:hypothetical protein